MQVVSKTSHVDASLGYVVKRLIDVVGSSVLLAVLAPLFAVVGLAIKLDSPGPVFFIQDRLGAERVPLNGSVTWRRTVFRVYKFRSMTNEADDAAHRDYINQFVNGSAHENADGPKFKMVGDPRVTRVGRWIRRTSVDELPQLINVVRGEMSLVGPRPVPTYEVEGYRPEHFERFQTLPGITGYWQVYGRGSVPFDEMMQMDINYVREQSLWLDFKLMALTLPAVVSKRGAN